MMDKFARIREEREWKRVQKWAATQGQSVTHGMSQEEADAFWESVDSRRAELPERFKNRLECIQDMYIVHGVEIPIEMAI